MTLDLSDVSDRIDESDLRDVEKLIGRRIPDVYRAFLLQNNGGDPDPSEFSMVNDRGEREEAVVRYFLGIKTEDDEVGIEYNWSVFANRLPEGYFPFARDAGGNLICIRDVDGKVFFWDHERESNDGEEPTVRNLYFASENFESFLNQLY